MGETAVFARSSGGSCRVIEGGAEAVEDLTGSAARGLAALEERAAHPESPQGVVGCSVQPLSPQGVLAPTKEEDEIEEIHREEAQPQTVCIFRKCGEEVVVMEEEDTTREVKRLWSVLTIAMNQIEVSIMSALSVFGVEGCGSL